MSRPRRPIGLWETVGVLAAVGILSAIAAVPRVRYVPASTSAAARTAGATARPGTTPSASPGSPGRGGSAVGDDPAKLVCSRAGNGGATDDGVTASSVKLGATVVDSGIGAAFLSDVRYGMQAVINRANAAGGICGRRIDLVLKDDGWDAQRGKLFIENLVEGERVFALAVVPSSEGLRAAGEYLRDRRVPVVGTDGMLISQYTHPTIWPVAASTITAMHIMASDAYDRGARRFAMVYDANFRFGVEGAAAFNAAVRRLTGASIPGFSDPLASPRCAKRFCGVRAGQPSYQTEVEVVRSACGAEPRCDFIAYLLEPETAQTWMRGGGPQAGFDRGHLVRIGGPQPLFNRGFGVSCAQRCHDMWVWTGFVPPVEPFTAEPPVARYVEDLRRTNARADASNSFVEGGYIGMQLLVDALRRTGPLLTRERLIAALDAARLDTGLSLPLGFAKGNHFANRCMMGFSIQSRPSFAGWRRETGWVCDPWAGLDIPAGEG